MRPVPNMLAFVAVVAGSLALASAATPQPQGPVQNP